MTCEDDSIAERVRILRAHGGRPKYFHKVIGGNFRLDAVQAAVLSVKLKRLDEWTAKRQQNADTYRNVLTAAGLAVDTTSLDPTTHDIGNQVGVALPHAFADRRHTSTTSSFFAPIDATSCARS